VTLPMTGNAPVSLYKNEKLTQPGTNEGNSTIYLNQNAVNELIGPAVKEESSGHATVNGYSKYNEQIPDYAYMGTDLSNVTGATINQLRQAISVQQYYEALARGGSRYREQVRTLWGVTISDKTVQVPEYLGGGRYHVNINQIIQTSGQQTDTDTPIGETGAMSVTPINESSFTKSFEEHGFVIGVACVRHNRSYQQGLERFWSRRDRLDYYVPQLANIGEQPVKKKEIMLTGLRASLEFPKNAVRYSCSFASSFRAVSDVVSCIFFSSSSFIGQSPNDYTGYRLATFNDETGEFNNDKEKVWEGKPHE
jgi:hypothetical protein